MTLGRNTWGAVGREQSRNGQPQVFAAAGRKRHPRIERVSLDSRSDFWGQLLAEQPQGMGCLQIENLVADRNTDARAFPRIKNA